MTDYKEVLMEAIQHYGEDHQINKAIEEMAELTVELAKKQNNTGLRINLINEIADVVIMLEQMKILFGEDLISNLVKDKVNRLKERMKEDQYRTI